MPEVNPFEGETAPEAPSPWDLLPKSPEGRPRLSITKPPTIEGSISQYTQNVSDWLKPSEPQIKPERPPNTEMNLGPDPIGRGVRSFGSNYVHELKEMASPFARGDDGKYLADQNLPEDAYKGKVPQTQKDIVTQGAPVMAEILGTFAGPPGKVGAVGALKAAGLGMFGTAKFASKAAKPAARMFEHGFLDTSKFVTQSGSKGTMEGGFKVNPATSEEFYVKQAPSLEQAKNEKLTAELYKLFGVDVADVHLTTINGKPGIASKKIEGAQLGDPWVEHRYGGYKDIQGLHENYPVHAMLANHDAVGTGPENPLGNIIVDKSGKAHVIDTGGGLLFKGTGTKKTKFSPEVDEIHTMADPNYSHLSAEAFGGRDPMVEKLGAQKVANSSDMEIAKLVEMYGPSDKMEKLNLLSTLLKRKQNIMEHYGVKPGGEVPKSPPKLSVVPKERDPFEQKPFTEEDYQKWAEDQPPPLPDDVAAPRPLTERPDKTAISPHSLPFAEALGEGVTNALMSGKKLEKFQLSTFATHLAPSSSPEEKPWAFASNLWQIAEHVNPQVAEALFRALPPKAQVDVGHRLAALRDMLEYSPFNSIAKGSGKDGKYPSEYNFYTTATHQYIPPSSVLKDPNAKKYADLLEGKAPAETKVSVEEPKGKYTPIPSGYASPWINTPKEAHNLLSAFKTGPNGMIPDYDIAGIGKELAKLSQEYPSYADNVFYKIPSHLQQPILKEFSKEKLVAQKATKEAEAKKAAAGDFSEATGRNYAVNHADSPIGIAFASKYLEPIKDWKNWKPVVKNYTKPHFKDMTQELRAKGAGFNTNFEIHKGGYFDDPHPADPNYPTHIKDPSVGKSLEPAWFGADESGVASGYGKYTGGTYIARSQKAFEVDWEKFSGQEGWTPKAMHNLIIAARNQGADLIAVHNIRDESQFGQVLQTQYAIINPAILRSPNAKFDPKLMHKAMPMAGLVGGVLFTYGAINGDDKMNRGGIPGLVYRAKEMAAGGSAPWNVRRSSHPRHPAGMIKSSIPGRTDKIPMSVPPGSYILPADIPSAIGEGNTMAGSQILGKMFKIGPYGSGMTGKISGGKPSAGKFDWMKTPRPPRTRADGGEVEQTENDDIPIIAAGGEYVIHPEHVAEIGHGDMKAGHRVLDAFVLSTRKRHIETLKKLKPPKR